MPSTTHDMTTTEGVIACYGEVFPADKMPYYTLLAPYIAAREHTKLARMDKGRDYAGILANAHLHVFYANHVRQTAMTLAWNILTDTAPAAIAVRDAVFSARDAPSPASLPAASLQAALAMSRLYRDQANY